jgi:hypothetical protein
MSKTRRKSANLEKIEDALKKTGVKISTSPTNQSEKCEYLKETLSLDQLKEVAKALNVPLIDNDTFEEVFLRIKKIRPDFMRGRTWNILRTLWRNFDVTSEHGLYALKNIVSNLISVQLGLNISPYALYEIITYMRGDTANAVGYAKYALERRDARRLLSTYRRKSR